MDRELRSIIPMATPRGDVDAAAQAEYMESIPGEVDLDRVVKAQSSAPQVVRRIRSLENLVWKMAQELIRREGVTPLVEKAKHTLKNRLEIDETVQELLGAYPPPDIVAAMHDEAKMAEIKHLLRWHLHLQLAGLVNANYPAPESNPFYEESDLIQRTERLLKELS